MEKLNQTISDEIDLSKFLTQRIIPDYLVKPNLVFELMTLGEDLSSLESCNASNLRSSYRSLAGNSTNQIIHNLSSYNESVNCLREKLPKVMELIDTVQNGVQTGYYRTVIRANVVKIESIFMHYLNRMKQIIVFLQTESEETLVLTENLDELSNFAKHFIDCYNRIIELQSLIAPSRPPSPNPAALLEPFPSQSKVVINKNLGTSSKDTCAVTLCEPGTSGESTTEFENIGPSKLNHGYQVNNLIPRPTLEIDSSFYNKLRNPVESFLKNLQPCDGLNIDSLLKFLEAAIKIHDLSVMSDTSLLQILVPYTTGPLGDKILYSLNSNASFKQFHLDLLKYFIPQRLLSTIKRDKFDRLQGPCEALSSYVTSIKEAAKLLLLDESEAEIVSTIISGLNPQERSRLVFMKKPESFNDLNMLAVHSQNIAFIDNERMHLYNNTSVQNHAFGNSNNKNPNKNNFNRRNDSVCYTCNQKGHISRNCYSKNERRGFPKDHT
ncbi:uncharacterized protein LOC120353015 isoform X1 [Nilaparvata lugens]|uniref:uncharacterized protein LOC120353015 isoform X1 n=1 Tax=Nilaparvata lugens TaxID=108931 RepID=UPI00193E9585|nr:uncharacterized protein LOC120353015 isoform X1 [Nilaparvata lugens]